MRTRLAVAATLVAVALPVSARAQTQLVDIRDLIPREHREQAFTLSSPQTLSIEAVAAEPRRERGWVKDKDWEFQDEERFTWPAAAWIIDARTREVVWDVRTAHTDRDRNGLHRFNGTVRLPAGTYIAHYGSYVATMVSTGDNNGNFASFLRTIVRRGRDVRYGGPYVDDGSYRELELVVRGDGQRASPSAVDEAARAFTETAFVQLRPDSGGSAERRAFELPRAADVDVVAEGEMNKDGEYDYAWIMDAGTHRRVWTMDYRHTEDGGGAHKNRQVHTTVHLPAGRYVAYYVTDDSHDPFDWNAVPPFDPENYGLTLRLADASTRNAVRTFDWEPVPEGQTIVSMVRVGDSDSRSEGFTLTRPMDVHIYAIGEGTDPNGDMDDYAWIVDASNHHRVWTMRYDDTEHAGGAQKNRVFDGMVHLDAGSYMVYYTSDGSHSYGHWNDAPPAEPRYWGISLYPESGRLDRSVVQPFTRTAATASIAELVRMRDDVNARRSFTIDHDQDVRVYALGEGTGGDMDDYGWIENAETGRAVWEMTYRQTVNGGGAEKNRLFDGIVHLAAGRYVLRWQSDGSHSFGDWNAAPPEEPEMWGITVMPARR